MCYFNLYMLSPYFSSGPRKVLGADNIVGYDSFEFSTIDAEGRRSVPATYSLTLTSPVFATATVATTAAPKGVEDARAAIKVRFLINFYGFIRMVLFYCAQYALLIYCANNSYYNLHLHFALYFSVVRWGQ